MSFSTEKYLEKYLKYKQKYLTLKNQFGSGKCEKCNHDNCVCPKNVNVSPVPVPVLTPASVELSQKNERKQKMKKRLAEFRKDFSRKIARKMRENKRLISEGKEPLEKNDKSFNDYDEREIAEMEGMLQEYEEVSKRIQKEEFDRMWREDNEWRNSAEYAWIVNEDRELSDEARRFANRPLRITPQEQERLDRLKKEKEERLASRK